MAFSFTFNGRVYTEADFDVASGEYAFNLGAFFHDALRNCTEDLIASTASSMTITIADKTCNIGTGKDFVPGMPIVVFNIPESYGGALYVMYGFVQDYTGSTLQFRCMASMGNTVGAKSGWAVMYAGDWRPSVAYSVGATTALGQRSESGVMHPVSNPFLIEDFVGYRPASQAGSLVFNDRLYVSCTGTGRIDFNELRSGGVLISRDDAIPNLGNHPGLARLSVRTAGDVAAFCFQNYGTMTYGMHEYQTLQIVFYMPSEQSSSSPDKFSLVMGLLDNNATVVDNQTDLKTAGFSLINETILTPRFPAADGSYAWGIDGPQTVDEDVGATLNPPGGAWYKLTVRLGEDFYPIVRIESLDRARPYTRMKKFLDEYITDFAKSNAQTPFVKLEKIAGNSERVIYVDYVAVGSQIGTVSR